MFINDSIEYEMNFTAKKGWLAKKKIPWKKFNLLNEASRERERERGP